jgi:hypothetical protein
VVPGVSKECGAFKPLGAADPTTQPHIPEDLNSQPECSLMYSQNLLLVVHNGMSRILGLFPFSVDSVGRHVRIQMRQRELLTVTEQPVSCLLPVYIYQALGSVSRSF